MRLPVCRHLDELPWCLSSHVTCLPLATSRCSNSPGTEAPTGSVAAATTVTLAAARRRSALPSQLYLRRVLGWPGMASQCLVAASSTGPSPPSASGHTRITTVFEVFRYAPHCLAASAWKLGRGISVGASDSDLDWGWLCENAQKGRCTSSDTRWMYLIRRRRYSASSLMSDITASASGDACSDYEPRRNGIALFHPTRPRQLALYWVGAACSDWAVLSAVNSAASDCCRPHSSGLYGFIQDAGALQAKCQAWTGQSCACSAG